MAVILVLVGGALGFTSAIASLVLFDLSLFQAFGLWMLGGFAAMVLAVLPALFPSRAPRDGDQPETA